MKIKISYDELPCEFFKEDFPIKYRVSGDYVGCVDKDNNKIPLKKKMISKIRADGMKIEKLIYYLACIDFYSEDNYTGFDLLNFHFQDVCATLYFHSDIKNVEYEHEVKIFKRDIPILIRRCIEIYNLDKSLIYNMIGEMSPYA